MKAAVVRGPNLSPEYGEFADPMVGEGQIRVSMRAAAISHLTRGRASGNHYSASGLFPLVPGVDGVGVRDDGTRVYCLLPEPPLGTMADVTVVRASHCIEVPPWLDSALAAAMAIPGMSSWAALTERARFRAGETVLVNGATGGSGSLAVQVARHLGAAKVIATGRNRAALDALAASGADVVISLEQEPAALEAEFRAGVDVVLDYLWGESALRIIVAAATAGREMMPMRFIQIGAVSGSTIALPSAALRSSSLELLGSGIGSVPFDRLKAAIAALFAASHQAGFHLPVRKVPLADIATAWNSELGRARTVIMIADDEGAR